MDVIVIQRIVTLLYVLVVAATIVLVILEKRQPIKTIAWALVLICLPGVGILLFYFLGQDIRRERRFQRRSIALMQRKHLAEFLPNDRVEVPPAYLPLASFFLRANYSPPFALKDVDIFSNGAQKMIALLRDIASAREHINIEYFIIEDDSLGRLFSDFLIDAVGRGVKVRLLYDDVGCWSVKNRYFERMRKAGVTVQGFMPVRFSRFTRRVNYRNHRKIAVIDGNIGYVGGMNIALRYVYGRKNEGWRDLHLRLTGNAVYGLQQTFVADWFYNCDEMLDTAELYPPMEYASPYAGALQIVAASPVSEQPYIMNGFVWAMMNARRYFYLATPYLMPTEQVLTALQMAAKAGVDVRIMVPEKSENAWIKAANESYYGDVLRAGARIYTYGPGFLHAKYFVCDDMLATVGSTNTDFRSFEDNFEVNAFIYDGEVAQRLRQCFERDMEQCRSLEWDTWKTRSRMRKTVESFVRMVSPLL